jgi:hypothetical protein
MEDRTMRVLFYHTPQLFYSLSLSGPGGARAAGEYIGLYTWPAIAGGGREGDRRRGRQQVGTCHNSSFVCVSLGRQLMHATMIVCIIFPRQITPSANTMRPLCLSGNLKLDM